ncbi:MAG TPA: MarR family transcriptional regulator, partial [Verrucomicrobiae bacterium]|nr:MarR family transcriptional regulator [Verrucomicrobiae bacterium]
MPKASPSQSAEDYLERIHELIEQKGYARVVDIASSLKVKQASVTVMVQKLAEAGFLKYEKYRGLVMTDEGRAVAQTIQNRHATLSRFFSLLGLDPETQHQ